MPVGTAQRRRTSSRRATRVDRLRHGPTGDTDGSERTEARHADVGASVFRPRTTTAKVAAVACAALLARQPRSPARADALWLAAIPFLLLRAVLPARRGDRRPRPPHRPAGGRARSVDGRGEGDRPVVVGRAVLPGPLPRAPRRRPPRAAARVVAVVEGDAGRARRVRRACDASPAMGPASRPLVDSPLRAAGILGRRRSVPRDVARLARGRAAEARAATGARRVGRAPEVGHRLAAAALRRRLRGLALAGRVRRPRRVAHRAADLLRRDGPRQRARTSA